MSELAPAGEVLIADAARLPRVQVGRVVARSAQMALAGLLAGAAFLRALVMARGPARERVPRAAGLALVGLCTRLGATFVKVGQIASTRADLLPAPLREALETLQDRVPPFPFAAVRDTIERELGGSVELVFSAFDPVPVAAASVAQVHRAVLRASGETVAVKVRRPDIAEKVALDRAILLFLARVLQRIAPTLRLISLEEALAQFCEAVEAQLDLRHEARNNQRFRAHFAGDPDVGFPRLHEEACTDSVLTMEFVTGVREDQLAVAGVDVRRVVEAGMRAVSRMIFLHGFVHADLHPGNLRFVPPGGIVFLDLGLVGTLSDEDRITTAQLLYALATGDGRTVARLLHENAPHRATRDYAAYEREIVEFVAGVRRRGLANLQLTLEIGRIFDILRRHHIQARSHLTMVNLALMTAEGLGRRLAPELALTDAGLPFLAEALGLPPPPTG